MKKHPASHLNAGLASLLLGLAVVGCKSIGPGKVTQDRSNYSDSLAESWKNQMLLNVVKVRYMDLPIFLDVGQVVTGYSLETSVNVGGTLTESGGIAGNFGSLGAAGRYTDRPTITYTPLTGESFLEGFLTPIRPVNVFSMLQAGYAADFILELCLDSLNGLHNRPAALASKRQADPEFFEVLSLLKEVQDAGAVGLKVIQSEDGADDIVFFFRPENIPEDLIQKSNKARSMLGIRPDQDEFKLVYSPTRGGEGELGIGTRSLWQILGAMAMGITIPEDHRQRGLVPPMTEIEEDKNALLRVHSGPSRPADYYVAVPYEGMWFWIANNDWTSKRTFTSILFIFTLADSNVTEPMPTITIPAQ